MKNFSEFVNEVDDKNIIRKLVDVSDLKVGDTVEVDGKMITVSKNDIKSNFVSTTFQAKRYPKGITKITFKVPTASGYRYQ